MASQFFLLLISTIFFNTKINLAVHFLSLLVLKLLLFSLFFELYFLLSALIVVRVVYAIVVADDSVGLIKEWIARSV